MAMMLLVERQSVAKDCGASNWRFPEMPSPFLQLFASPRAAPGRSRLAARCELEAFLVEPACGTQHCMATTLETTAQRFTLDALLSLDASATNSLIFEGLREKMLEPHPRRQSPMYSGVRLVALCKIDPKSVPHLAKRGNRLGKEAGNGQRRFFIVADGQTPETLASRGGFGYLAPKKGEGH